MRKYFGKHLQLSFLRKMMKNLCETPIDMDLVKKITKSMQTLFNGDKIVNCHTDQILVLEIIQISMKAANFHEVVEEKGVCHQFHI